MAGERWVGIGILPMYISRQIRSSGYFFLCYPNCCHLVCLSLEARAMVFLYLFVSLTDHTLLLSVVSERASRYGSSSQNELR